MRLIVAENGGEALNVSANREIDVVIAHIHLPGPDGYKILKALKSSPNTQAFRSSP